MRLWQFAAGALTLGLTLSLVTLTGCGSKESPDAGTDTTPAPGPSGKPKSKVALMPGKGTIKGTVTLAGDMPNTKALDAKVDEAAKKEASSVQHCMAAGAPETDKGQQVWRIKDGKVKNVAVFLVPVDNNTIFAFSDKDPLVSLKDKPAALHQPYCAFHPHVQFMFTKYRSADQGNKLVPTGQELTVYNDTINDANKEGFGHNTHLQGPNQEEFNQTIGPGGKKVVDNLIPERSVVNVSCDVHKWMSAFIWVRDNPYYAVTDEKGEFTISNVPTGKVGIVAWHEGAVPSKFLNEKGINGDPIDVKEGETVTKDFTIKAK